MLLAFASTGNLNKFKQLYKRSNEKQKIEALYYAIKFNKKNIINYIFTKKLNYNIRFNESYDEIGGYKENNLLSYCCYNNYSDYVKILLDKDIINIKEAFHQCIENKNYKTLQLFFNIDFDWNPISFKSLLEITKNCYIHDTLMKKIINYIIPIKELMIYKMERPTGTYYLSYPAQEVMYKNDFEITVLCCFIFENYKKYKILLTYLPIDQREIFIKLCLFKFENISIIKSYFNLIDNNNFKEKKLINIILNY